MQTYNKIETLYKRDLTGSKKLIEGDFRNPTVEYLKDLTWIGTEKIDGTNIRVHWDGHRVEFAGRSDKAEIPIKLYKHLQQQFETPEVEEIFEQAFGEKDVILFGEGYGPGIQSGGSYRKDVSFILFDVMINSNYQSRDTVCEIAQMFNIDVVPVVFMGTLEDAVGFVRTRPKSYFGTADMEGIVMRPQYELKDRCGNRLIVKIKVVDFCE